MEIVHDIVPQVHFFKRSEHYERRGKGALTPVPYTHDYTYCAIALQKTKTSEFLVRLTVIKFYKNVS